ncbi:hypothetical protein BTO05_07405 [Winogradskyella sp. PC-19]|uniref:T9SS type A sorting domain-containing protein n=1 Tax=unclassified Winogradskyella TaxID=2615021 RepID=UPI000B564930|nr:MULTISPECIES: T9SS type A sorting domain-containing protein [unclassified Winogradskyella]ARV09473.1 hypothetical protein BTO05_07405 [Winogradskyella sp. PC-19]
MRFFNQCITVVFLVFGLFVGAQQITLNACNNLLDNQDYIFEQINLVDERNIFQTVSNPSTGSRDCSGIGFCKLQMVWSDANMRWEIKADDGNDGFTSAYVLYYNDSASKPNPPDLTLGTWEEATTVTQSQCGAISSLTGTVQNSLSIDDFSLQNQFSVYPNPVKDKLYLVPNTNNESYLVSLYNVLGKRVFFKDNIDSIDVTQLKKGVYFLKIEIRDSVIKKKILIQ